MLIKVKTLTGKEIEIDIEPTDKVERIKVSPSYFFLANPVFLSYLCHYDDRLFTCPAQERVEEKEGIPPPQQRLIFSGKQMNDEKIASDYKVGKSVKLEFPSNPPTLPHRFREVPCCTWFSPSGEATASPSVQTSPAS